MGMFGGKLGKWILSKLLIATHTVDPGLSIYSSSFDEVQEYFEFGNMNGLTIMDFGCGYGRTALEIAQLGPRQVIGLDVRHSVLSEARKLAENEKLSNVKFANAITDEVKELYGKVDIIVSIDAFEHYGDPAEVLDEMDKYLGQDGRVYISFGPPWWHPYGAHLQFMTRLPWPHVMFTERVLMAARSLYKTDGAMKFEEVGGGLNRMSVRKFEQLIHNSVFRIMTLQLIPIRRTNFLHTYCPGGRELFTSVIKASLQRK
jgi:SAM-dependent methyltransferase